MNTTPRRRAPLLAAALAVLFAAAIAARSGLPALSPRAGPARVYRLVSGSGAEVLVIRLEGDRLLSAELPSRDPGRYQAEAFLVRSAERPSYTHSATGPLRWEVERPAQGRASR